MCLYCMWTVKQLQNEEREQRNKIVNTLFSAIYILYIYCIIITFNVYTVAIAHDWCIELKRGAAICNMKHEIWNMKYDRMLCKSAENIG